jgi:signal transduction histidine kinase/ActR/RegA family two-component response regulator
VRKTPLRTRILLALLAVSAGLTWGTLSVVRYTMERKVRESIRHDLLSSVRTFRVFEQHREEALTRSVGLLASLPTVRALMATQDISTISDEAVALLKESGADLLLLADRTGRVYAVQAVKSQVSPETVQKWLDATVAIGETRDWWLADGRLYEVILQPVEFVQGSQGTTIGILVAGREIDQTTAREFSAVAGSDVVFLAGSTLIANNLPAPEEKQLLQKLDVNLPGDAEPREVQIGQERYLARTENLSRNPALHVSLNVLKSFDQATSFLNGLNRLLVGLGLLAVIVGSAFGFLISHSITQPLEKLVLGVKALEQGDYNYPLTVTRSDEVGLVTRAFARMRTSLQRAQKDQQEMEQRLRQAHKMEAVGRLAGGVAHDFNNLLTIIRGHSDLLAERIQDDSQAKNVDQVRKAADRAVGMTRQLLAFSRMQVLQPRALDLNSVIQEMSKMLPRLIGENIEYCFLPATGLATVMADPGQIEQVLMNLAVNARDAMPDGGKLQVSTANVELSAEEAAKRPAMSPGRYVLVLVADTGHGMDEETKAHIFEPFFTTKEVGKGTGLGLATVYGIVKQSGGFIWVESFPGRGTEFEVYLPATAAVAAGSTRQAVTTRLLPGGTETILLVEDEAGVRELAGEFLRAAGYKVLEGHDGADALEIARRYPGRIDLLLTDMVMPRLSGKKLAELLLSTRPGLKVVLMTGYTEFNSEAGVRGAGPAMISKPFSMTSLVEKMDEVLHGVAAEVSKG